MAELPVPPRGTRLFQINEEDLATLERDLPRFVERMMISGMDNGTRVMIRRVQEIVCNVRWNYGPPSHVQTLPAGDGPDNDGLPSGSS